MQEKRSSLLLRVTLGLLFLANLFGLVLGLTRKAELLTLLPGLEPVWPLYLACPVLSLVALGAMWQWRRWGLWLALAVGVMVLAIEVGTGGWAPHVFRVPIAMALLAFAAKTQWSRFR